MVPDVSKPSDNQALNNIFSFSIEKFLFLAFAALFYFKTNMGVADYAFELGKDIGLKNTEISNLWTIANIISISGGVMVYVLTLGLEELFL